MSISYYDCDLIAYDNLSYESGASKDVGFWFIAGHFLKHALPAVAFVSRQRLRLVGRLASVGFLIANFLKSVARLLQHDD